MILLSAKSIHTIGGLCKLKSGFPCKSIPITNPVPRRDSSRGTSGASKLAGSEC
ncbi:hypothetical protein CAL7102_03743 [Dulcicalothrix desertica PCC 7102]|nr:hypothetical protein CAL7102_03743 [Dulcicalothrix desertica PCC 7102]